VILIGGAFCDRATPVSGTALAGKLADRFTVFSYDRRGRGDSGDTAPYAIDREVEDLSAIIAAAGGSAFVFGNSSGALLALDAAIAQRAIMKLCCYEPPVILDPARVTALEGVVEQLVDATAGGRRAEAVELFLTKVMQMPAPAVAQLRASPMGPGLERLAHTLSYDVRITTRGPARQAQLPQVRAATLVMNGGASPPWMRAAIEAVVDAIPGAHHRTLAGQGHVVDLDVLAGALRDHFAA
jgi:pimeloyl-ACP methyl ester carboxylesterase